MGKRCQQRATAKRVGQQRTRDDRPYLLGDLVVGQRGQEGQSLEVPAEGKARSERSKAWEIIGI